MNHLNSKELIEVYKPTNAFIGASWLTFLLGITFYCIGLWNAEMQLNEKGYYFTLLLFGLFSIISIQKAVRDKAEGIPISEMYTMIGWFACIASLTLMTIGLWNADLLLSEKGFYAMTYILSLFASICIQKNTRDLESYKKQNNINLSDTGENKTN